MSHIDGCIYNNCLVSGEIICQIKKLYTRAEFEELRRKSAHEMAADQQLIKDALALKVRAGGYYWVRQTNWMGEPILQLPQDMFAFQEIVYKTKPKFIVELGVAWGGPCYFTHR